MEQAPPIYVITEQVRQALITVITRAVHPNSSFEQINGILVHLNGLSPVQVHPDPASLAAASEFVEEIEEAPEAPQAPVDCCSCQEAE